MMPPTFCSSSSMRCTRMRSWSGLKAIGGALRLM
jgi:hypothetical protein